MSSSLLFAHPLVDELIGLDFLAITRNTGQAGTQADEELNELRLEEFSSSETYNIDEHVDRDLKYITVSPTLVSLASWFLDLNW
jgi:hypothetical protein